MTSITLELTPEDVLAVQDLEAAGIDVQEVARRALREEAARLDARLDARQQLASLLAGLTILTESVERLARLHQESETRVTQAIQELRTLVIEISAGDDT